MIRYPTLVVKMLFYLLLFSIIFLYSLHLLYNHLRDLTTSTWCLFNKSILFCISWRTSWHWALEAWVFIWIVFLLRTVVNWWYSWYSFFVLSIVIVHDWVSNSSSLVMRFWKIFFYIFIILIIKILIRLIFNYFLLTTRLRLQINHLRSTPTIIVIPMKV